MPPQLVARLKGLGDKVSAFTLGQKVLTVIGVAVLALGGTALVKWASTPTYSPLFSNLAADDASAITDQLTTDGVKFELTDGGQTILVPQESVSAERLKAAAAGLPSDAKTGYSLLDTQGVTSSQFQQKVTYQRALEGELATTIQGIDGVRTAVVHLAIPEQSVFTDTAGKPTASVLVDTKPGTKLTDDQVQAVVHLVSSSVPDLDADQVTVSDAKGQLLSAAGVGVTGSGSSDGQTAKYETDTAARVQAMLDRVLGPGKAVASVNAELNYDQTQRTTETFSTTAGVPPLSESNNKETYTGNQSGVGGALGSNGVLGMDGEETTKGTGTTGGYVKESNTRNNAVNKVTDSTTVAPGSVRRQSVAVVVDTAAAASAGIPELTQMVTAAAGVDTARGDTLAVNQMAFDTSAADTAKQDLAAAKAAQAAEAQQKLIRQGATALVVLIAAIIILVLWRRAAKRRRREVVDIGALERLYPPTGPVVDPDGDALALPGTTGPMLTPAGPDPAALRRAEVGDLVDSQPAEVADLLRGWLTETKRG